MPSVTRRQFVLGATVGSTVGQQRSVGLSSDGNTTSSWRFGDDNEFKTVPSVGSDLVYGASKQGADSATELYALNVETGDERWRFSPEEFITTQAVESSGLVYVGGKKGLYAVDSERGEEQWHFETNERIRSTPTVGNGVVYAGSDGGKLYALDANSGDDQWHFDFGSEVHSQVVVDGRIYVAGIEEVLCLDVETGDKQWHNEAVGTEVPLTVHDNWVYVQYDGVVYALDDSGDRHWRFSPPERLTTDAPAILDDVAYIGTAEVVDNFVYGVDAKTGEEVWRYTPQDGGNLYVAAGTDSLFVVGDNLYAVNPTRRRERWVFHPEFRAREPPVVGTERVYILSGRWGPTTLHARSIADGGSGIRRQLRRGAESGVLGVLGIAPALLLALLAWNRYRRNQNSTSEIDG